MKIFYSGTYNYANNATELEIENNAELHNIVKIHDNYVGGILSRSLNDVDIPMSSRSVF